MNRRLAAISLAFLLLAGCAKREPTPAAPPRIVTFAPHITDIAFDMGLGDHIVGVSSYCMLPAGQTRTVMGNAMRINSEAILLEDPDILFYNTRDSDYGALRRLRPSLKLVRMRNGTLDELREGITAMGEAVDRPDLAAAILGRINGRLDAIARAVADRPRPRVLFLRGYDPPSTIGAGWTTAELLSIAGGANAAAEAGLRKWATINIETIRHLQPDVIICLTDPGEANLLRGREFWTHLGQLQAVRDGRVYVTDDRRLTIPGSRVGETAAKLARMIHPDAFVAEPAAEAEGGGHE